MKKSIIASAALALTLVSCENSDKEFPDYVYQTISFATQAPIRTIIIGDDGDYSTVLDNEHRFEIYAVLGGVNTNKSDRWASCQIDSSLLDGLTFEDGRPVRQLPESYYNILGGAPDITIPKGSVLGCFGVQLTDAFFADPASTEVTYVLPVRLVSASDSILQGRAKQNVLTPDRLVSDDWDVLPKDYTLYAVTYINKYHGVWLSTGTDQVTVKGQTTSTERNPQYLENADRRNLSTRSLSIATRDFLHTVSTVDADGSPSEKNLEITLDLNFDGADNCTVTTRSENCTASGTGKWVYKGAPKAWGDRDRDLITLEYEYEIRYVADDRTGQTDTYKVKSTERLVMRDRAHDQKEFTYTKN